MAGGAHGVDTRCSGTLFHLTDVSISAGPVWRRDPFADPFAGARSGSAFKFSNARALPSAGAIRYSAGGQHAPSAIHG